MKILLIIQNKIPVSLYGGTERVVWDLGRALSQLGHEVSFLAPQGSTCDFAPILHINPEKDLISQIKPEYDILHFHCSPGGLERLKTPYVMTMHGNVGHGALLDKNTIFVSHNHATRYGSQSFVHNGMDWDNYQKPNFKIKTQHFHFLGKAAWRVKNVQGAIDIIKSCPGEKLKVLGGHRFNFKMGMRFTFSPKVSFAGMVGGSKKFNLLNASKGLIFPVKWHEPFGLAVTESLYYGCPIFATPYGALPELVPADMGFLSNKKTELAQAIINYQDYSREKCHQYAKDEFNSHKMALAYLEKYQLAANGHWLNPNAPSLIEPQSSKWLPWD